MTETVPVETFLPAAGSGPGVLVLHEIFGVSDYIRSRCRDLASAGYVVHAPLLFARLDPLPTFDPDAEDYVLQGVQASRRLPWDQAVADASSALDALRAAAEVTGPVAILGFCYGGGLAYAVAGLNPPDALVAYYGSALPSLVESIPWVDTPSLHHFGTKDSYLTADKIDLIAESVAQSDSGVQIEMHAGAGHAFDNPHAMFHHAEASSRAWAMTLAFLDEHLRP